MSKDTGDDGLAEGLIDAAHQVLHLFADAGRAHRLSQQQVELICAVIVRESVRMSDLGRVLHVEKSGLSNLVDRLEQRGLVTRYGDPDDRRATRVALTDEGTATAMTIYHDVTGHVSELVADIPHNQRRATLAAVRAMSGGAPATGPK
jgi:DNA-binding MarR family transcriptional regulator